MLSKRALVRALIVVGVVLTGLAASGEGTGRVVGTIVDELLELRVEDGLTDYKSYIVHRDTRVKVRTPDGEKRWPTSSDR